MSGSEGTRPSVDVTSAVLALLLSVASVVGVFWMLDWPTTEQNLALLGGLSGAAATQLASMLRTRELSPDKTARRSQRVTLVLTYVAGFLAGGFSVLASVAFLSVSANGVSMSGAAMLGGIYGVLLGSYWAKVGEVAAAQETLLARTFDVVEDRIARPPRTNWRGYVWAKAHSLKGDLILAELVVWFEADRPASSDDSKTRRSLMDVLHIGHQEAASRARRETSLPATIRPTPDEDEMRGPAVRASLAIEDGENAEFAEFVVTVAGTSDLGSFPRRQIARVPAEDRSADYTFSLVRERDSTDMSPQDADDSSSSVQSKGTTPLAPMLVDISMAGRTVQVMEVRLRTPDD
jgi:hypothetical protein